MGAFAKLAREVKRDFRKESQKFRDAIEKASIVTWSRVVNNWTVYTGWSRSHWILGSKGNTGGNPGYPPNNTKGAYPFPSVPNYRYVKGRSVYIYNGVPYAAKLEARDGVAAAAERQWVQMVETQLRSSGFVK